MSEIDSVNGSKAAADAAPCTGERKRGKAKPAKKSRAKKASPYGTANRHRGF